MVVALSNLILLMPIACVLAIMLSMTGSTVLRARNDGVHVFVQIVIWQFALIGLVGLMARSSFFSLIWLIFALGFLMQLWYWERGLARNILLLVIGTSCKSTAQLNKVVHYLNHEGRGYWRRLGRRFGRLWQATGNWELALIHTRLARPVRMRLALANLPSQSNTVRFTDQLARVATEQKLTSQWFGRLLVVCLSFFVLMVAGTVDEWAVGPMFREMLDYYSENGSDLRFVKPWAFVIQWKLHIVIPIIVWLPLLTLYAIRKIPFFARHRPIAWFLRSYYRALVLEGLADGLKACPDPGLVCSNLTTAMPVPSWSRKLQQASRKMSEGQPVAKALASSGVLKKKESVTLALCRDADSLAWGIDELAQSLLQRTLNRAHIAIQLLTVGLTIVAALFTTMYAVSTFGALTTMIELQL